MRTDKQLEASRLNGAKTGGPVTPEGKKRVSQNALRHGLYARSLALQLEDKSQLLEILRELTDELRPATFIERRYVETMATAQWKQIRFLCAEKVAIDLQTQVERKNIPDYEHDGAAVTAQAITHMTEDLRSLREINLHSARLNREYDRTLVLLLKLQDRRGSKPDPSGDPQPVPSQVSQDCATEHHGSEAQAPPDAPSESPVDLTGQFLGMLPDEKITEQTHHPLKTNAAPSVSEPPTTASRR